LIMDPCVGGNHRVLRGETSVDAVRQLGLREETKVNIHLFHCA